ncbi:MAG: peptidoglycan DD-metalloendopeptidase family protein [Candidatus Paceibacterota bacterium]
MKIFKNSWLLGLITISLPFTTSAAWLDNKPVKDIPVPVLFGIDLNKLIPDFGDSRGGGTRLHEGQDMRAPKGTPIISPTDAIVRKTGEENSAGKFVYTDNPGGENFRYMHLDTIEVKVGDKLKAGDLIGTVGDTGNAPDGVYHLHFEIRKDRKATDPFPRLVDSYNLKEKMALLDSIFDDIKDEDGLAEILVSNFSDLFQIALNENYDLPRELEKELTNQKITSTADLLKTLNELIDKIPILLNMELNIGDENIAVSLLQTYLIFSSNGPNKELLANTGATGYFGPLTKDAMVEYQKNNSLPLTGIYDQNTRLKMIK